MAGVCRGGESPADLETPPRPAVGALSFEGKEIPLLLESISEDRDSREGWGNCTVEVAFALATEKWMPVRLEIESAVDNEGNDLLKKDEAVDDLAGRLDLMPTPGETTFDVSLKSSARSAKTVKEVKGTLVLQARDAKENILTIPDILAKPGEFIENEQLAERGLRLAYIDAKSFDEKGGALLAEVCLPDIVKEQYDSKQTKVMLSSFKAIINQPGFVVILLDDPEEKVLRLEAVNSDTGAVKQAHSGANGMYLIQAFDNFRALKGEAEDDQKDAEEPKPQIDQLRVYLKNKDAEKKAPFVIHDVPLP